MKPLSVPPLSDVLQSRILDIAQFVALARTTVDRDRNNREITYFPYPEVPTRLSKQLCDLARGIAMAREKSKVTASDVRLVQKVATDCIPANRLKLLKMLVETYPEKVRRSDVRDSLKISYSAAKFWLDDLYVLEVLDRQGVILVVSFRATTNFVSERSNYLRHYNSFSNARNIKPSKKILIHEYHAI